MSFEAIIGLIAPVILTFLMQGIKKLIKVHGYVALAVVFVIGGLSALAGVGPIEQVESWVDTTVNAGWVIGVATFIYSLIKKRTT